MFFLFVLVGFWWSFLCLFVRSFLACVGCLLACLLVCLLACLLPSWLAALFVVVCFCRVVAAQRRSNLGAPELCPKNGLGFGVRIGSQRLVKDALVDNVSGGAKPILRDNNSRVHNLESYGFGIEIDCVRWRRGLLQGFKKGFSSLAFVLPKFEVMVTMSVAAVCVWGRFVVK